MTKKAPKTFIFYVKESSQGESITNPVHVWLKMKGLKKADQESFWVIGLNGGNKIILFDLISLGGVSSAQVDPVIVFKRLVGVGASSFICVHNHPSGNTRPSREDKNLTKRLREGGKILNIELLDSIIIGDTYLSFKEGDLL